MVTCFYLLSQRLGVLCASALAVCLCTPLAAAEHNAIGRLNTAGYKSREMCSGTLIAPDLVLTAAHCVVAPEDGYLKRIKDMVFVAGWDGAGHAGAAKIKQVSVHPDVFDTGRFDLRYDVALLQLSQPLDVTPLRIGIGVPAGPLDLIGYPRSAPHKVRVESPCVGTDAKGVWRIACQVEQGQSGGPVVTGTGNARRVVAVIVAISDGKTLAVPVGNWVRRSSATLRNAGATPKP